MTIPKDFEFLGGAETVGKSGKYRECHVVVRVNGVLRQICWIKRGTDHSVYFGLSKVDFLAREMGIMKIVDGVSSVVEVEDLTQKPKEKRTNPKASLHPAIPGRAMAQTHIRATDKTYLMKEPYIDWHPVTKPFMWLQASTGPLKNWPVVGMVGPRDGDITLPPDTESIRVTVAILPETRGMVLIDRKPYDSITGFGGGFGVQVAFHPERAAKAGIQFFTESLRRFQGPVKPAAAPPPAPPAAPSQGT